MSPRPPALEDDAVAPESALGSALDRLAPLSLGAVASSALIVAASAVLRSLLGPRRRALGWLGVAALVPLAVWVLWEDDSGEPEEPGAGGPDARTERSRKRNGG